MATLTTAQRAVLPTSAFAGPGRTYPVPDASHAQAALARAEQFAPADLKARIDRAVHHRYPSMGHETVVKKTGL